MVSKELQKAREFENRYMPFIPEETRPAFHLTGGIGWINDPNGFSFYKGEYHLFYQSNPYTTKWNTMHWGHAKTRDFIRWERLPTALAPDMPYDKDGCFSGSAVELPDGRHLLLYTGVHGVRREDGYLESFQTQCVAVGDGVDYEKYEGNPVIDSKDIPDGGSKVDFRDPKLWREEDGTYRCVVGNRTADGSGAVLLYRSEDGFHWTYVGVVDASHNEYGRMWECPDFFPLGEKQILMVSPQEMVPMDKQFHAGDNTMFLVGRWEKEHFTRQQVQAVDYGIDFYAPQTTLAEDGRRIMVAWMQSWATSHFQPPEARFFGQMILPRELSLKKGRLIQTPVRELEGYRGERVCYENVLLTKEQALPGIKGRILDMALDIRPAGERTYAGFRLNVAMDAEHATVLRYTTEDSVLQIDRSRCGFNYDTVHVRDVPVRWRGGKLSLRLVMDRNSLEIFVNGGEQAASFILYTPETVTGISFEAEGGQVLLDVEKFDLKIGGGDHGKL